MVSRCNQFVIFCAPSGSDSRLNEMKTCTPEQRKLEVSEMHQRTQRYCSNVSTTTTCGPGVFEPWIVSDSCIPLKMCMFLQTVRAAGGGEASEGHQKQTGSLRKKQTEGQRVPQGKTDKQIEKSFQKTTCLPELIIFPSLCRKLYRNFVPSSDGLQVYSSFVVLNYFLSYH